MKDIRVYLEAFSERVLPAEACRHDGSGCVLKGCIDLYGATGDAAYRDAVLRLLEARLAPDGSVSGLGPHDVGGMSIGRALFFALDETGDERYRRAIERLMQRLREQSSAACGSLPVRSGQSCLEWLYATQPFAMQYEMRFGGMEHVGDVARAFKTARSLLFDGDKGLYHAACDAAQSPADGETGLREGYSLRETGFLLMALIDCIELCSEQLYEHYRAMIDIFREAMRGLLRWQDGETGLFAERIDRAGEGQPEVCGSAMAAYALLKAVRLGVLDEEKYMPIARRVLGALAAHTPQVRGGAQECGPGLPDDGLCTGVFMMVCSEALLAGKE